MKWTRLQIERCVRRVLGELKSHSVLIPKVPEDKIFTRAVELIQKEFDKERELEKEAHQIVDDLEKKNAGGFERHKMFLMVKKKLAKEKKVVL